MVHYLILVVEITTKKPVVVEITTKKPGSSRNKG